MRIWFLAFLIPVICQAQKIETAVFDPLDSVYKVKTKEVSINGTFSKAPFSFECARYFFTKAAFKELEQKTVIVHFYFKVSSVMSLDEKSTMKIQFDDDQVKEYPYFGNYRIFVADDFATFSIEIPFDDYLFTHNSKIIRIPGRGKDMEMSEKNANELKASAILVRGYNLSVFQAIK